MSKGAKAPLNPMRRLSAFKQVLEAAGLSTLLMIMALYASRPRPITEFEGWILRPSIAPSVEHGPEGPADFLQEISIDISRAFASAADYTDCIPAQTQTMNPCEHQPKMHNG
jgi:hypothetical protein